MGGLPLIIAVSIGSFVASFVSWFLAGRRTLYVLRLEIKKAGAVAFIEDLVPYLVIGGLLCVPSPLGKAAVALCGAAGGALGLALAMKMEKSRVQNQEEGKE